MDYWSEDFDADKNCLQENKIIELQQKLTEQVGNSLDQKSKLKFTI